MMFEECGNNFRLIAGAGRCRWTRYMSDYYVASEAKVRMMKCLQLVSAVVGRETVSTIV